MAVSQVSGDGDTQTCGRHCRILPFWPSTMDRQLRAPLRLHFRLPHLVRNHAIRDFWNLRKKKKIDIVVDLSSILHFYFCRTHSSFLRDTNPRL